MKTAATVFLIIAAVLAFCAGAFAQTANQYEIRKWTSGGMQSYWITGENSKAFGIDGAGVPGMISISGGSTTFAGLTDVALTSLASGDFLKWNGTDWINRTAANARTDLGLGTLATQSATISDYLTVANPNATGELNLADSGTFNSWQFTPGSRYFKFIETGGAGFYVQFDVAPILTANRNIAIPNASGTMAVSASGNIALSAAGNITFTGTLPVANGGTGITALGTGVATALGNATGGSGGLVTYSGGIGTATATTPSVSDNDTSVATTAFVQGERAIVTKNTASSYTVGTTDSREFYGGVIYVTGAATITIPAVAAGASFTVITVGAVAVSVDPNASDLIYLNGTALSDGDKVTNTSTTGDIAVFTYYDGTGWYCNTNSGWVDGN